MKNLILIFFLLSSYVFSKEIEGMGECVVPDNMTVEQAKGIALSNARKNAIDKFGFYIEYSSSYSTSENNGEFKDMYNDIISSDFAGVVEVKKIDYNRIIENGITKIICNVIISIDEASFKKKTDEYIENKKNKNSLSYKIDSMALAVEYHKLKLEMDKIEFEKKNLDTKKTSQNNDEKVISQKKENTNITDKPKEEYISKNFEDKSNFYNKPKSIQNNNSIKTQNTTNENKVTSIKLGNKGKTAHFINIGLEFNALIYENKIDSKSDFFNMHNTWEKYRGEVVTLFTIGYNLRHYTGDKSYFTFGLTTGVTIDDEEYDYESDYLDYWNKEDDDKIDIQGIYSFTPHIDLNYGFIGIGLEYKLSMVGFDDKDFRDYMPFGSLNFRFSATLFKRLYLGGFFNVGNNLEYNYYNNDNARISYGNGGFVIRWDFKL